MRGVNCDGSTNSPSTRLHRAQAPPGEVRLAVNLVGVCDTDLQLAKGYMGFRGVLGHEFVGSPGRPRVAAEINNSCHALPDLPGRTASATARTHGAGHPRPRRRNGRPRLGPRRNLHHVPDAIDDVRPSSSSPSPPRSESRNRSKSNPAIDSPSSATASSDCSAPGRPPGRRRGARDRQAPVETGAGRRRHPTISWKRVNPRIPGRRGRLPPARERPVDGPGPGPAVRDGRPEDDGRRRNRPTWRRS